jgi:hypothetical protein
MSQQSRDTNRRNSSRRQPKQSAKITCRAGTLGLGPNVAIGFLDVSESGIRLIAKTALTPGGEVEIGLQPLGSNKPTAVAARVIWSLALADGNYCIGARFEKRLPYTFLQEIATVA